MKTNLFQKPLTRAIFVLAILSSKVGITDSSRPEDFLERIAIEDTYSTDSTVYRWQKVPVLFGRSATSQIDSSRPIIPCERVLKGSHEAQALLKKIFQEQEAMLRLVESLKDASPEELEWKLHLLRKKLRQIEKMQTYLSTLYPIEFQQKDRVRTLSWLLKPTDFANLQTFPHLPKIEWAQFEVLSGEGGWFGTFLTKPSSERPIRQRFESWWERFRNSPQMQAELQAAFSSILKQIQEHFSSTSPGSHGIIDWQGGGPEIQLMQELSPVEACVPHVALTGSLLLDLKSEPSEEYPNPTYPSHENMVQLGMGPVLLTYDESLEIPM